MISNTNEFDWRLLELELPNPKPELPTGRMYACILQ